MAFNALIHSHRPDLLDFPSLEKNTNIENLNIAFDVANNELGIPRLLDAEGKYQVIDLNLNVFNFGCFIFHLKKKM